MTSWEEFQKGQIPDSVIKEASKLQLVKRSTQAPAKQGFFENLFNFIDRGIDTIDNGSKKISAAMDRYGQAKAGMKYNQQNFKKNWNENVINTPRYRGEDWIEGIPNIAVIAALGGVLLLVMMKKGN